MKNMKLKKILSKQRYSKTRKADNEIDIVKVANIAFNQAAENTQRLGLPIIKRENNKLIKVYPNGKREFIKTVEMVKVDRKSFYLH